MDRKTQKEIDELSKETTYTFEHIKGLCDRHKKELLRLREALESIKIECEVSDFKYDFDGNMVETDLYDYCVKALQEKEVKVCECGEPNKTMDTLGWWCVRCGNPLKEEV